MPRGKKAAAPKKSAPKAPRKAARTAPAKEARSATPPPIKAHNGLTVTEMKSFLLRATNLETEELEVRETLASIRNRQRQLKKNITDAGGNYPNFKVLFASTKMRQEEAEAWLGQIIDYHAMINIRVSFDESGQGTMADLTDPPPNTEDDRDLDAARSYQEGYKRGIANDPIDDNPYQVGTITHVQWRKGHSDGGSAGKVARDMERRSA